MCDDGSTDMTAEIAEKLGAEVVQNGHRGKGYALRAALSHAKRFSPAIAVTLDDDEQHDSNEIPRLVELVIEEGADIVVGSRYLGNAMSDSPLYRRIGLRLINAVSRKSCNSAVKDTQCGFIAYSSKALETVLQCESDGYEMETEQSALDAKNGLRVVEVPVTVRYKGLGKTSKLIPLMHGSDVVGGALRLIVEERPMLLLGVPEALLVMFGITTESTFYGTSMSRCTSAYQ